MLPFFRVWRNSEDKFVLESQKDFMVAGDSAYSISPTLMKPYKVRYKVKDSCAGLKLSTSHYLKNPSTRKQRNFNKALSALRTVTTENVIGMCTV